MPAVTKSRLALCRSVSAPRISAEQIAAMWSEFASSFTREDAIESLTSQYLVAPPSLWQRIKRAFGLSAKPEADRTAASLAPLVPEVPQQAPLQPEARYGAQPLSARSSGPEAPAPIPERFPIPDGWKS